MDVKWWWWWWWDQSRFIQVICCNKTLLTCVLPGLLCLSVTAGAWRRRRLTTRILSHSLMSRQFLFLFFFIFFVCLTIAVDCFYSWYFTFAYQSTIYRCMYYYSFIIVNVGAILVCWISPALATHQLCILISYYCVTISNCAFG